MDIINKIKKIGLGTVQFGSVYGISNQRGQTTIDEVASILDYAKKVGIKYLDTASAYGQSESVLGQFNLNDYRVVSKFLANDKLNESIEVQFEETLQKLHVNKLYAYMFHRPNYIIDNPNLWNVFADLKQKNLVEKIGYSLNEVLELDKLLDLNFIPDIIQVPYNLFDNRFESYMKDLKAKGCEIHTRSTFLQGLFFVEADKLSPFFSSVKSIIYELQNTYGNELPKALLDYVISKDFVDVAIIGVETKKQLESNVRLNKSYSLELDEDIKFLEKIIRPFMWPKLKRI